MSANKTLPEAAPKAKTIPAEMTAALLRLFADSLEAAMNAQVVVVTRAQRIGEFAGAEYSGEQVTDAGTLHYYREPVTGTSLAVWERNLTVTSLKASIEAAHLRFGVEVAS